MQQLRLERRVASLAAHTFACCGLLRPAAVPPSPAPLGYRTAVVAGALLGGVVVSAAAPRLIAAAGFGSRGIVAGSAAARIQSAHLAGTVPALFATLMSWGAAGMGTAATCLTAAAGAAVVGGAVALVAGGE